MLEFGRYVIEQLKIMYSHFSIIFTCITYFFEKCVQSV